VRTPLTYYGGKQQLAATIIKAIPEHKIYVEPFVGGGAVFFSKEPSQVEVINDINSEMVNFYQQAKVNFSMLEQEVKISLHSRDLHRKASVVYSNPDMFDPLRRAWAVWVLASQSFGAQLDGTFGYDRSGQTSKKIANKRESFTFDYAIRLQNVQIECADALRIIRSRDTPESFFYCDPPYYNSDMGHYDGYTVEDFEMLLKALSAIEGRFLMSSYPSGILSDYSSRNKWSCYARKMKLSMGASKAGNRTKVEVLTANYPIPEGVLSPEEGWTLLK
jgi:DNA adenine methylase